MSKKTEAAFASFTMAIENLVQRLGEQEKKISELECRFLDKEGLLYFASGNHLKNIVALTEKVGAIKKYLGISFERTEEVPSPLVAKKISGNRPGRKTARG